jgi:phospholipid N-methyltransferase
VNTYSHVLCTWAAARRLRSSPKTTAALAAAGAGLPDLPYIAKALTLFVHHRDLTRQQRLAELDFFGTPNWTPDLVLHSLIPIVPALALARKLRSSRLREGMGAFAAGWAAHNAVDFLTHAGDARPHLWPLSRWRWHSPVSYWDRRSHAIPVLIAEHALLLGLALNHSLPRAPLGDRRPRESRRGDSRNSGLGGLNGLLKTFIKHPRQVGALVPTSQATVRAMLDMADLQQASCIVELGAGTGVYTAELLRRVGPQTRVLAFEIDPRLASMVQQRLPDPRLRVVADSAEQLGAYLDGQRADVVVSALPFTTLPSAVREAVYKAIAGALAPNGVMLAIQYSTARQRDFEGMFSAIRRRRSFRNVPPALLYACRGLVDGVSE